MPPAKHFQDTGRWGVLWQNSCMIIGILGRTAALQKTGMTHLVMVGI